MAFIADMHENRSCDNNGKRDEIKNHAYDCHVCETEQESKYCTSYQASFEACSGWHHAAHDGQENQKECKEDVCKLYRDKGKYEA